ncbi:MAG: hypothetical protein JNL96_07600 [Planctomycetaceae bacterium]|nr:hypothetical protein [Planctomycetaceae bacterium]
MFLLAWVASGHDAIHRNPLAAVAGVAVVPAWFGIVVLHELGRWFVARRFGIRTQNITLLPIGGWLAWNESPTTRVKSWR